MKFLLLRQTENKNMNQTIPNKHNEKPKNILIFRSVIFQ